MIEDTMDLEKPDQHIDPVFAQVSQKPQDVLFGGYVEAMGFRAPADFFDLGYGFLSSGEMEIGHEDRVPLLRQPKTETTTQPAACAGNENAPF